MARRKAKVTPTESLLGNMGQDIDTSEWIGMNQQAMKSHEAAVQSPISAASTAAGVSTARAIADRTWSKLGIAVDVGNILRPNNAAKPASPIIGMRRQANNLACCEKTLQEYDPETSSRKVGGIGSYAILHSEPNLGDLENSSDDATSEEKPNSDHDDNTTSGPTVVRKSSEQSEGHKGAQERARQPQTQRRSALLHYFAKITRSTEVEVAVDLDYMKLLLDEGANVDECDDFGQTVFHEVSRAWGTDVAQFLVDEGQYHFI